MSAAGKGRGKSSAVLEGLDMLAAVATQELQGGGSSSQDNTVDRRVTRRRGAVMAKAAKSTPQNSLATPKKGSATTTASITPRRAPSDSPAPKRTSSDITATRRAPSESAALRKAATESVAPRRAPIESLAPKRAPIESLAPRRGPVEGVAPRRAPSDSSSHKRSSSDSMEAVSLEQMASMSGNTLVKLFAEADFNEMKRTYRYTCNLLPTACKAQFQSFGSETKAKKEIQKHVEHHVKHLVKEGDFNFMAEPTGSKNKKPKEKEMRNVIQPPVVTKPAKRRIIKQEPTTAIEKENTVSSNCKRRKEDLKPTLSEISNEFSSRRYSINKESEPGCSIKTESSRGQKTIKREKYKDHDKEETDSDLESLDGRSGPVRNRTIDEDHCYAHKIYSRIKDENVSDTESDPEADENYSDYGNQQEKIRKDAEEAEMLTAIQAITDCEVVFDVGPNGQLEGDYSAIHVPTVIQQEVEVYDEPPTNVQPLVSQEVSVQSPDHQEPYQQQYPQQQQQQQTGSNDTSEVIQWAEDTEFLCYTEEVSDKPRTDTRKLKNKRTAAAVSLEDQAAALEAMDELRGRGATTDDLVCRLCQPPRPFTAYSTLLTHYRSHAGLRPFECQICQATFTRQHSLNYHLMTHNNQTRFTCPTCNRKFRHPTHYKEHVKKHGETVQFACTMCEVSLSTQVQYRKHLKTKHSKTLDIYGNIIDFATPDPKEKQARKRKREPKKKIKEEPVDNIEEVFISNPEMFEEVQMINTSSGLVLHQTGEIFASENGHFYQVATDPNIKTERRSPVLLQENQNRNSVIIQEGTDSNSPMLFVVENTKSQEENDCKVKDISTLTSQSVQTQTIAYKSTVSSHQQRQAENQHKSADYQQRVTEYEPMDSTKKIIADLSILPAEVKGPTVLYPRMHQVIVSNTSPTNKPGGSPTNTTQLNGYKSKGVGGVSSPEWFEGVVSAKGRADVVKDDGPAKASAPVIATKTIVTNHQAIKSGQQDARTGQQVVRSGLQDARTGQQVVRPGQQVVRSGKQDARTGQQVVRSGQTVITSSSDGKTLPGAVHSVSGLSTSSVPIAGGPAKGALHSIGGKITSALHSVGGQTAGAVHHNVHLPSRAENLLKDFPKGSLTMSYVTLPAATQHKSAEKRDETLKSTNEKVNVITTQSSAMPPVRDNIKASSLSSKAAFPAVVAVPMHQGSYPNVVALPVHEGTGSLLPSTILNELSGGTAEISGGSADRDKQSKENEEKFKGAKTSIKMGEANTGASVRSEEGNSSSVSILERALTEVFPEELEEENKSSQAESQQVQAAVPVTEGANFGYPGNYLFPSNIEATMEKVQVATDAIRDIIGLTS